MALALARLAARRGFSSAHTQRTQFESLCREHEELLPASTVTKRLLDYLLVAPQDVQQVLAADAIRPLPYKTLYAPAQVHRLTPLVQWSFQQVMTAPEVANTVFTALEPHANMARRAMWQQYYRRQFFLSGAPMRAYLLAYKHHKDRVAATQGGQGGVEGESGGEAQEEVEAKGDGDVSLNKDLGMDTASILTDNNEWEWVPSHVALSVAREFCFRGRFDEAIEAYTSLPLSILARQKVAAILHDYEQYPSLLRIFEIHRATGDAAVPLDAALELDALKKIGRVDEVDMRFQALPAKDKCRADIQQLMET
ncbi:unnamed protein product [Hyaloperonospora brassicae]|uniref:Uncharacterized protein n=1 Tax=Hyaloperonospora brassicae TaxID=162125 RepID=A0AAV0TH57_HYABA|nr:unnamed protein product [Hyaloperonospora brassicae]CAI5730247.1 unnamed protein product [Hyaloperonospora brassicae]